MGGDWTLVRMSGPLEAHVPGFAAELEQVGYTRCSTTDQVRLFAHLSRWLAQQGLGGDDLTPSVQAAFLAARRAAGYRLWLSPKALVPMLEYLRRRGVAPPEPALELSPTETMLERYRVHLTSERGLTASTAAGYIRLVRPFLVKRRGPDGALDLAGLTTRDITDYMLSDVVGSGSAKLAVTSLRSVLTFLHRAGILDRSLSSAVPAVAGTRLGGLPRALKPGEVDQLLETCNRDTVVGRRDFAVLTVLARLGLRAGEVVALELGDIDWRRGEVIVRGKGDRRERLPLPVDVGRAIAAYLRKGRPPVESRNVFLRVRAPHRALSGPGVSAIVTGAALKAGMSPVAAHRLRHTAATAMLRGGASLAEVGQILRHRSSLSTAIYAKVDRVALRQLARPWPGGRTA